MGNIKETSTSLTAKEWSGVFAYYQESTQSGAKDKTNKQKKLSPVTFGFDSQTMAIELVYQCRMTLKQSRVKDNKDSSGIIKVSHDTVPGFEIN